jgi:aminoglycoside phosphotransferase (APT) family kinase protein
LFESLAADGPPSDDALTPETLEPLLRERLGGGARCRSVERGPVGNGQETWFLGVEEGAGRRELVLRRSAAASTLAWTQREHEFRVLRAVRGAGLPVPEVLWAEGDPSRLDRPYFVMERMPGAPPGRADAETRDRLARSMGRWLARLHALDPDALPLDRAKPDDGAAAARSELAAWRERYLAERLEPVPLLGALLAWLEREAPEEPAPAVLLWGDPGPHNVLLAGGEVSALLDWELSHLGHPLEDLGAAVWACLGELDSSLLVDAYERERGEPVERGPLRWFECFACVNRSIMLVAGTRAYVEGRTRSPALAGLGLELLADNLTRAARAAGWPEPGAAGPPAAPRAEPAGLRPGTAELTRGVAAFLGADVLPAVPQRHLHRGIKTAVALLETAAERHVRGEAVAARRAELAAGLERELSADGGPAAEPGEAPPPERLERLAVRIERDDRFAHLRERTRLALLRDLALERELLWPLRELYAPSAKRRAPGAPQR